MCACVCGPARFGGCVYELFFISFCSPGRYNIRTEPRDNKTYFLVLEINGVNAQDAGNYKVTAKNALGESNATIRLNFDSEYLLAFCCVAYKKGSLCLKDF